MYMLPLVPYNCILPAEEAGSPALHLQRFPWKQVQLLPLLAQHTEDGMAWPRVSFYIQSAGSAACQPLHSGAEAAITAPLQDNAQL